MLRSSKAAVLTAGSVSLLLGGIEAGYRQTIVGAHYFSAREALLHSIVGILLLMTYKCSLRARVIASRVVGTVYTILFCVSLFVPTRVSIIMGWPTHEVVLWMTFVLAFLLFFSSFPHDQEKKKK